MLYNDGIGLGMIEEQMTDLEKELYAVLDLIVMEFKTDPMSVQCFDLRTVERAKKLIEENREEWLA